MPGKSVKDFSLLSTACRTESAQFRDPHAPRFARHPRDVKIPSQTQKEFDLVETL